MEESRSYRSEGDIYKQHVEGLLSFPSSGALLICNSYYPILLLSYDSLVGILHDFGEKKM